MRIERRLWSGWGKGYPEELEGSHNSILVQTMRDTKERVMSSFFRISRFMLCGVVALVIATVSVAKQPEPLRIGIVLSLSGPAAAFGIPERNAVQVLTEKINAEGGVNGRQIELFIYDDATNPTEAARGAQRLI